MEIVFKTELVFASKLARSRGSIIKFLVGYVSGNPLQKVPKTRENASSASETRRARRL